MSFENIGFKIALALGIIFILIGIKILRQARTIRRWPTTTGRLESGSVKVNEDAVDSNARYEAMIIYSYQVNGQNYRSDKYLPYHIYEMKAAAEKRLASISQEPKVYYNPANPGEAALNPGSIALPWGVIIMGAITAFIGIMALNFD